MELLKPDALALLWSIVAGLVATALYHRLIDLPRPEPAQAIIQAAVFTATINFLVTFEKLIAFSVGYVYTIGYWTADSQSVASFVTAIFLAVAIVRCTSKDETLFRWLREHGFTGLRSYPSEWFGTFKECAGWVVLHFKDGRRLKGEVVEWATSPTRGHIALRRAKWLVNEAGGDIKQLDAVALMLINVEDVRWVEFLKPLIT